MPSPPSSLAERCRAQLRENDRGPFTIPSVHLYPHAWGWDSAFCALGYAHIDPRRGAAELGYLVEAQRPCGLVPHIRFSPGETDYAPGPEVYGTAGDPVPASTITQPPIAAIAARVLLEAAPTDDELRAQLRDVALSLERWHAHLARRRDPAGTGAVAIVHPWESGMDNAPRWDRALAEWEPPPEAAFARRDEHRADPAERPHAHQYLRYGDLVRRFRETRHDPARLVRESPFLVEDVSFSALFAWAERELLALRDALDVDVGCPERTARAVAGVRSLRTSAGFRDRDLRAAEGNGAVVEAPGVFELTPLCLDLDDDELALVLRRLDEAYDAPHPLPSLPVDDDRFEPRRYWRGPTWVNVNWVVIRGLERNGELARARRLARQTLSLVDEHGFSEHYHPESGAPGGAAAFSWSAALALDLLERPVA